MSTFSINCDIGERGAKHSQDRELMGYIDMANIASGGHAGDEESIEYFREKAEMNNIKISAHLSYPDVENFGRVTMDIPFKDLSASLTKQINRLDGIKTVKFHGALYNDACWNSELADNLVSWMCNHEVTEIITLEKSELHKAADKSTLNVIKEIFAERRYYFHEQLQLAVLVPRTKKIAEISTIEEAVAQIDSVINFNQIKVFNMENDNLDTFKMEPCQGQTACVYSAIR